MSMAGILPASESRTASLRQLAAAGRVAEAEAGVTALLADLFGLAVRGLRINSDQHSLQRPLYAPVPVASRPPSWIE